MMGRDEFLGGLAGAGRKVTLGGKVEVLVRSISVGERLRIAREAARKDGEDDDSYVERIIKLEVETFISTVCEEDGKPLFKATAADRKLVREKVPADALAEVFQLVVSPAVTEKN